MNNTTSSRPSGVSGSAASYRMSPWLPRIIRLSAVGTAIFFAVLALHSLRLINLGEVYLSCVRWGTNSEAYELMICTVYLVWSVFLWMSARDPLRQKLFLDFTIWANGAHFSVMLLLSRYLPGEQMHTFTDVLGGWVGLLVLMAAWLPARRYAQ